MSLQEVNQELLQTDCDDLHAVATALTNRARVIAQFAAVADQATLEQTYAAGEEFRERLELSQINASRELDGLRKLKKGLQANIEPGPPRDQIVCFG
jgi:hypothetical protein